MSFALSELARLLNQPDVMQGVVIEQHGSTLRVATAQGAITALSSESLSVGERVLIQQGNAYKAPQASQRYAV